MTDEQGHSSPHDALFKRVFGRIENAAALLRCLLPSAASAHVDWSRLELQPGSYVDAHLSELESDLVFSAHVGGRRALFYVLLEHQSSVDRQMPWRLWRYVTRLWDRHTASAEAGATLPLVVPVVVYHGARAWTAPMDLAEMIDVEPPTREALGSLVPRLGYLLDDLRALDPMELRVRALPAFGALALWALRTASDRSFGASVAMFADLFDVVLTKDGPEAIHTLLRYLSIVTSEDDELLEVVLGAVSNPVRSEAMNHYNRILEQGREEGREEGRVEGRSAIVLKQISLKFGEPSPAVRARLLRAGASELDRWAERILTAERLDDVFA